MCNIMCGLAIESNDRANNTYDVKKRGVLSAIQM